MATLEQIEQQIFDREGFRVRFVPFANASRFASYAYPVMASNAWRVSEWKNGRLATYLAQIRSIEVLRGDGTRIRTDLRLGALRDSYFEAFERGTLVLAPVTAAPSSDNVVQMRPSQRRT